MLLKAGELYYICAVMYIQDFPSLYYWTELHWTSSKGYNTSQMYSKDIFTRIEFEQLQRFKD